MTSIDFQYFMYFYKYLSNDDIRYLNYADRTLSYYLSLLFMTSCKLT